MKIKNLSDLRNADIKFKLEKIPTNEIIIKSVDNFCDGPLSGECTWRNKEYYYQCFDQIDPHTDEDLRPRKYLLLHLTPQQFNENSLLEKLYAKSADSDSLRNEYLFEYEKSTPQIIRREQIIAWFEE